MALDFKHDTKYAQPLIDKKMREVQNPPIQDTNQPKLSIADELSKLAKLKEPRSYNRRRIFADEKEFNGRNEINQQKTLQIC
jgi:hypothetical protein